MNYTNGHAGYGKLDEANLIQCSLEGDMQAWGEIIRRYEDAVYGVCLRELKDKHEAEDAKQEAFIRAFEQLHHYDQRRKFSTWLFTVAKNNALNSLRHTERVSYVTDEDCTEPESGLSGYHKKLIERSMEQPTTLDIVMQETLHAEVTRGLSCLDDKYKKPIESFYLAGLEHAQIARQENMPVGTVKTRIHRGKSKLKIALEEKGIKADWLRFLKTKNHY